MKSFRVGALNVCSHNGWRPSKEPCAKCVAFFDLGAAVPPMRTYANDPPFGTVAEVDQKRKRVVFVR